MTWLLQISLSIGVRFLWLTWLTHNSQENNDSSKLLDSLTEASLFFIKCDRSQAVDLALTILSLIMMCAFSG